MYHPTYPVAMNNTKNFVRRKGRTCQKEFPFVASKAILDGFFVAANGAGLWDVATPASKHIAKLEEPIRTTDADFAVSGKRKSVMVPTERDVEFKFVTSVAFTLSDVGKLVNLSATAGELNTSAVGTQFEITEYINPTTGRARLLAY